MQAKPYRRRTLKQFQNVLPSLFLIISSHLKTLVKAKLIDLRLNPSMPLLHFREMISRKRIVKWWMIQRQKAFRDTLKKFLMQPGSYRPRLPSRRNQKTWTKPFRLFLTTFQLTPQSGLYGPGKYLREWRIKHPLPPEKCRRCLSCCQMHGQENPTMFDWK